VSNHTVQPTAPGTGGASPEDVDVPGFEEEIALDDALVVHRDL
jgi:hypothetical protein